MPLRDIRTLEGLRARMSAMAPPTRHGVIALDGADMDQALGGGLALGALHVVEGAGIEAETGAVPAAFLACLLQRLIGRDKAARPVFWISASTDLYAPGLLGHGFDPACLIQLCPASDDEALSAMEMLLRSAAPAAVVSEIGRVGRLAGQRLQMACLGSGCTGFVLRRWPHGRRAAEEITAAVTRWRLGPAPSARLGRAPGAARWQVELLYSRAGPPAAWTVEQEDRIDAPYPFRLAAGLAHPASGTRRLAG